MIVCVGVFEVLEGRKLKSVVLSDNCHDISGYKWDFERIFDKVGKKLILDQGTI